MAFLAPMCNTYFIRSIIVTIPIAIDIESIKGFLPEHEGEALYRYAFEFSILGPCLEVGSYCGRSTIYLASACRQKGSMLYAIDHHRGSEEHQPGEEYHDPELYDPEIQAIDSFREFRRNIDKAGLADTVIPIVASSPIASKQWGTPLSMVFIDGGHSEEAALADYRAWAGHVRRGGVLAIHDLFPDPSEGGQAPYRIWQLALASGFFKELEVVDTLGFLKRL